MAHKSGQFIWQTSLPALKIIKKYYLNSDSYIKYFFMAPWHNHCDKKPQRKRNQYPNGDKVIECLHAGSSGNLFVKLPGMPA
jgi:hypothetical protein